MMGTGLGVTVEVEMEVEMEVAIVKMLSDPQIAIHILSTN